MPLVQYGTYAGANTKDELETVMEEAVRVGYRAFDTAECYGTEENVGRALDKVVKVLPTPIHTKVLAQCLTSISSALLPISLFRIISGGDYSG